jgi:hypothetical protein
MRVKKEAVKAFGRKALAWNSIIKAITSCLTIGQQDLKKLILNPSGPGLLLPNKL